MFQEMTVNMLSVPEIVKNGHLVSFKDGSAVVKTKSDQVICSGTLEKGDYKLKIAIQKTFAGDCMIFKMGIPDKVVDLWHRRLGHLDHQKVRKMLENRQLQMVNAEKCKCAACVQGKSHRSSFAKQSMSKSEGILDLVHSDVWGPAPVPTKGGARYFVSLIDDFS